MGYYTYYKCEIQNRKQISDETWEQALNITIPSYDVPLRSIGENHIKWYEHEEEMKDISKKFPAAIFKLSGEGENAGDLWIKYFKNGKMQECPGQIIYEEYNEKKLQ